jgi:hypothetical protein
LLLQTINQIILEIIVKHTTRNTLLGTVAAAALLMGAGLACAQDTKDSHGKPGEAAHDQKAPEGKMDQHPGSLPQKSPAPTAQAPMRPPATAEAPMAPPATAQAPAASKLQTGEAGSASQKSESPKPQTAQGAAGGETKSGAPAALSAEQHVKLWNMVRGEKTERLTDVHFSITVGEVIPGTVHLYRLPISIVEYAPQYRDYEYILVGDEILIVDPSTLRIVAVIAA